MSKQAFRMLTNLTCMAVLMLVLAPHAGFAQGTYSCYISTSGGNTCDNWNVSVTNTGGNTRTGVINLGASFLWQYVVVRVRSCDAWGWTFHMGDSVSNNGGGGDAADTQHDAEIQAYYSTATVFASDYASPVSTTAGGPPASGCAVQQYRVYNHFVEVDPNVAVSGDASAWIYYWFDIPPYDEADSEDTDFSELYKIYFGLNRTYADASRNGSGAQEACVFLSTSTSSTPTGCPF